MCIWIFFSSFFSSPALFESPRDDRLCTVRSRKGMIFGMYVGQIVSCSRY